LKSSFADDFKIAVSGPDFHSNDIALNKDMFLISQWAKRKKLKISHEKSQCILFTPWTKEHCDQPQVFFEGNLIQVSNQIKILGLLLDTQHTMTPQLKATKVSASKCVPIMKAVMAWGFKKADGLRTFKSIMSPKLGYGGLSGFG
jgi:hypothetical protein